MAEWLRERYPNARTSSRLGSATDSVDEIVTREFDDLSNETIVADCWAFSHVLVERLIGCTSRAAKVGTGHLNLGNRWAWIASDVAYAGSDNLDVFSINCYARRPDTELVATIRAKTGKPVMIGEWHFGAVDRGALGSGLQGVPTQADRGLAYRAFLETAASTEGLVGAHWFQLYDQGPMGRFDGENWNIGLLDVCSRPYPELVDGARITHERLYDLTTGAIAPITEHAPEAPKIAN